MVRSRKPTDAIPALNAARPKVPGHHTIMPNALLVTPMRPVTSDAGNRRLTLLWRSLKHYLGSETAQMALLMVERNSNRSGRPSAGQSSHLRARQMSRSNRPWWLCISTAGSCVKWHIHRRDGVFIVLISPDGAGSSSLVLLGTWPRLGLCPRHMHMGLQPQRPPSPTSKLGWRCASYPRRRCLTRQCPRYRFAGMPSFPTLSARPPWRMLTEAEECWPVGSV